MNEALSFEKKVFEQLREIFREVGRSSEWRMSPEVPVSRADIVARARDGRLVLFEAKMLKERSTLPSSWYLQLASYRHHLVASTGGLPPILALVINVGVDENSKNTFAKSGIPVFQLGSNVAETRKRMREAFSELSIQVPELESSPSSYSLRPLRCFVTLPRRNYQGPFRHALEQTLYDARAEVEWGSRASFESDLGLRQRSDLVRTFDVVIADLTESDPAVLVDIGIATALNLPLVLLSRESDVPHEFIAERIEYYDVHEDGLERLGRRLLEILRPLEFRRNQRI